MSRDARLSLGPHPHECTSALPRQGSIFGAAVNAPTRVFAAAVGGGGGEIRDSIGYPKFAAENLFCHGKALSLDIRHSKTSAKSHAAAK